MINIFQPSLGKEEVKAIEKVFESNWIGKGPQTELFEKLLATKLNVNTENITTTTCCTEGIFQILEFLNLPEGSEVILPSISFVGVGNAILSLGAKPIFCDIDERTLNVTSYDIVQKITSKTKKIEYNDKLWGADPDEYLTEEVINELRFNYQSSHKPLIEPNNEYICIHIKFSHICILLK